MKKITSLLIAATFCLAANAQINFKDSEANMAQAGTVKDTISTNTVEGTTYNQISHTWHFNTNKAATIATEDPNKAGYLGAPQKASTRKGWRGTGVQPSGAVTGLVHGNLGKTQGYTGGGDPVHFASITDLRAYLSSTTLKYTENDVMQNDADSAVTTVIDVEEGNAVWAIYPGKYKKTDTRVYYNLGGSVVSSDLSFDILTVDPGTSGKTVSVKLIVSIAQKTEGNPAVDNATGIGRGADKTDSATIAYPGSARFEKVIYTSGDAKKTVNICKEFGLSIDTLNFKKIIVALITESSSLTPEEGVYDPVIGYDNFNINLWYDTPVEAANTWVAPSAGKLSAAKGEAIVTSIAGLAMTHNFDTNVESKSDTGAPDVEYNGVNYHSDTFVQSSGANGQFFIFTPSVNGTLDVCGKMGDGKKTLILGTAADIATLNTLTVKTIVAGLEDEELPAVKAVGVKADGTAMDAITEQSWDGTAAINDGTGGNAWVVMSFPVTANKNYAVGVDGSKMQVVGIHFVEGDPSAVKETQTSATKAIGLNGQIEIRNAESMISIYSITGQKIAALNPATGSQFIHVHSGIYLVAEKNQPTQKVFVK